MDGEVAIDRGRLRLAGRLDVSLQRAIAPAGLLAMGEVPRSHGLAAVARVDAEAGARFLAPVAEGEVVWLGFAPGADALAPPEPVTVRVRSVRPGGADRDAVGGGPWGDGDRAAPLRCPPDRWLAGVLVDGGMRPFGGAGEERLEVVAAAGTEPLARVVVDLVRPDAFTAATGLAYVPLDPGAAYGGELLG